MAVRSTIAPSALETTFWVTTRTSLSSSGSAPGVLRSALDQRRGQIVTGADLRHALEGDDRQASGGRRSAAADRAAAHRPSLVVESAPVGLEQVVGGIDVEGERPVELQVGGARGRRRRLVRRPASLAETEVDGRGRCHQKGVSAAAVPIGDQDDHRPVRRVSKRAHRRVDEPVDRRGRNAGQVGGQDDHRRGSVACSQSGLVQALVEAVCHLLERGRAHSPRESDQIGIHGHDYHPGQASCRSRGSHGAPKQGQDQVGPLLRVQRLPKT